MKTKLQNYDKYKSSGLDWLGDIPDGWEVRRVKEIFNNFGSGSTPQSSNISFYEDSTISWLNTTDLDNGYIYNTKEKITNKALKETNLKIYPQNSLVIAMYGQGKTRATVGLLKIKTCTNQACCVMYKTLNSDEKYILWWFINKYEDIRSINIGATQPNMNKDFVRFLCLAKPQLQTQIAIAEYLDTQTTKIDQEIELLTTKVSKYKNLKQTLISNAVTKGVDKSAQLKPTGVEWIGDIPQRWEVRRLKEVSNLQTGNSIADKNLHLEKVEAIPYIATKDINIENQEIEYQNGIYISKSDLSFRIAKVNTILLCIEGGSAGKKIAITNQNICYVNKLVGISPKTKSINYRYQYYFVQSNLFKYQFFYVINGLIGGVSVNTLKSQLILVPPLKIQQQIADYLDQQTGKIDQIITTINTKIIKLREYRKVLVNDVVTGRVKIEV